MLGRILGDTLREQEGDDTFDLIERIRQTAIRFRREGDTQARAELESVLSRLSDADSVAVIRAFTYFSQLANIAEDLHRNRRRRAHQMAGSPPREALAVALSRVAQAGLGSTAVAAFFREALISPVLTAHPTEVQRKSILDCQLEIARLLAERDRLNLTAEERAISEENLRRVILTPVADAHPARAAADGARRDRERPVLLSLHLPAPGAAPVRRDRGPAQGAMARSGHSAGADPADGSVDRRRSRRQPVRYTGRNALRAEAAILHRARFLPERSASTRSRAVAVPAHGRA